MDKPNDTKLTKAQFDSLHLWLEQLAETLRAEGIDMKTLLETIKYPIIPTKDSVKELLFKPILKVLTGKDSTKDINRKGEIDDCVDVICKALGERGIKVPLFPSYENKITY